MRATNINHKWYRKLSCFAAVLAMICCMSACNAPALQKQTEYGVFIGVDPENMDLLYGYSKVVIDAAYYTEQEIQSLHQQGVKVYSYLNIGSIETFRKSCADFEGNILGAYENWPDEYWVDVSAAAWQEYIAQSAAMLAEKGVDGFFLDNADVYYLYPRPEIFQGLVVMIDNLQQYGKDILINGGNYFVSEAVLDPATPLIQITGVNQECVFTNIDFENNRLLEQDTDISDYFQSYLEQCKDAGLAVFLTEYAAAGNAQLEEKIAHYCKEHQFKYFVSSSVGLEG